MIQVTKDALVYDILTTLRAKGLSQDELIPLKHLSWLVDNQRSILISQQYERRKFINPDIVQTLPCVDVEIVDSSYCPCEITGCNIYRTEVEIPNVIEAQHKNLFTRVGSIMLGTRPYQQVSINRLPYINGARIAKDYPRWFLHGGHLYFLTNSFIDKVSITAVFDNPEEAGKFNTCSGIPCYTDNSVYPVSRKMIQAIKDILLSTDLRIESNPQIDTINNSNGRLNSTGNIPRISPQRESAQPAQGNQE